MKGEIDKDFYCTASGSPEVTCPKFLECKEGSECCYFLHHKWPTPEQYLVKWDKKWDGAVYAMCEHRVSCHDNCHEDWMLRECVDDAMDDICQADQKAIIVCACTPWGKPLADWRPE